MLLSTGPVNTPSVCSVHAAKLPSVWMYLRNFTDRGGENAAQQENVARWILQGRLLVFARLAQLLLVVAQDSMALAGPLKSH